MFTTQSNFVSLPNGQVHYLKMGEGNELLVAFHGYGQQAKIFNAFSISLEKKYTTISIDLPFHGSSTWNSNKPMTVDDLDAVINEILKREKKSQISLMGYSIGARVCLTLLTNRFELVKQCILLAPEGLWKNKLYLFATHNPIGKMLFSFLVKNPFFINVFLSVAGRFKYIRKSKINFIKNNLNSEKQRKLLLNVWPNLSNLIPDYEKLDKILSEKGNILTIFNGKFDIIVPTRRIKKLKKEYPNIKLFYLARGHKLIDKASALNISEKILE